jgi:putative ABC transport system substrate-binding protein
MRRRDVTAAAVGATVLALARPSSAEDAAKLPLVGFLLSAVGSEGKPYPPLAGVLAELKKLGYQDGRNIRIIIRGAEMNYDRLPALAAELVQMRPDVIVSIDTPPTRAAIAATRQIPIVMWVGDPIATGFVDNLAHPGGNVTGASAMVADIAPKRLQIFKEAVPTLLRVAALFNPNDPLTAAQRLALERARPLLDVEPRFFPVRAIDGLGPVFDALAAWRADGVFWLAGQETPFIKPSIELATARRLPVMVARRDQLSAGGLLCYGALAVSQYPLVAAYIDKILRGAKPGDLPIQQPPKISLGLNLKTARTLGLTVPPDEIIE